MCVNKRHQNLPVKPLPTPLHIKLVYKLLILAIQGTTLNIEHSCVCDKLFLLIRCQLICRPQALRPKLEEEAFFPTKYSSRPPNFVTEEDSY